MPRKVTAWACEHRCFRKVDTSKQRMIAHEQRCHKNPDNKCCATCRHYSPNDNACCVNNTVQLTKEQAIALMTPAFNDRTSDRPSPLFVKSGLADLADAKKAKAYDDEIIVYARGCEQWEERQDG